MSIDNLFVEGPQFSETAKLKLPPDPEKWPEEIISQVKEQFPVLDSLPLTVKFTSMDEQSGTAIGSVTAAHPHLKKAAYLPVVIEEGMMFPLDIWQDEKQMARPIGPDTFQSYFFDEKAFQSLEKKKTNHLGQYFDDPSMWNSTYPPLQGRYAYASVSGAMLGEVLETASEEDLKDFSHSAGRIDILAGYKKSGNLELIQKIAAKQKIKVKKADKVEVTGGELSNTIEEKSGRLPINPMIAILRKDPKGYSLLSATDKHFIRKASFTNKEAVEKFLHDWERGGKLTRHGEDHMNEVIRNGESVVTWKVAPKSDVFIQDDFKNEAVDANTFDVYRVRRLHDNVRERGVVIPTVIDFEQNIKGGERLFLGGTNSVLQGKISGVPAPTSADVRSRIKELKSLAIQTGQTGTFIYFDGGSAVGTVPVQIIRSSTCGKKFRVADMSGNVFFVSHQHCHEPHTVQRITKFKGVNGELDEYIIPQKMIWVPMAGFRPVSSTVRQFIEKTAHAQAKDIDPLRITWTGINFEVRGRGLEKNASGFDLYALSEDDVKFLGLSLGASQVCTQRMVKVAKEHNKAIVHGLNMAAEEDVDFLKCASIKTKFEKFFSNLKTNLVKEASVITDQSTVDTILSLNFINKENIQKFVDALPVLMQAHQKLAELTLAARLGANSIPHDATVVCMNRMTSVIQGLLALDQSLSPLSERANDRSKARSQEAVKDIGGM